MPAPGETIAQLNLKSTTTPSQFILMKNVQPRIVEGRLFDITIVLQHQDHSNVQMTQNASQTKVNAIFSWVGLNIAPQLVYVSQSLDFIILSSLIKYYS